MLFSDVVRLYRRLPCGCSKATIWNHWVLDAHVSLTGLFDNGLQIIGVAWAAGIRTTIARFIAGVVSASRECPVVENWNHWELDVHMLWNSILFNLLGALEVARPKSSKSLNAVLLGIMLSARRGGTAATIWNHWEIGVHIHWNSIIYERM